MALVAVGLAIVLVIVAALIAPRLINLAALRGRIAAQIARRVHGTVELGTLRLSLLGTPHLVADRVNLAIPGRVAGTIGSVAIYPHLEPLLHGALQLAEIRLSALNLTVEVPQSSEQVGNGTNAPNDVRDQIAAALGELSSTAAAEVPGLTLSIGDGTVVLAIDSKHTYAFGDIKLRMQLPPDRLR
ncbi:MAG TPA: hypothetical protein VLU24_04170, partial [Mycobacterium sp.]|nr:hypothetical protein [Mycobacterium sp.]